MSSVRYQHLISIPMLMLATTVWAQNSVDRLVDFATQAAASLAANQVPGNGTNTDLTLEDAITRALERNLDMTLSAKIVDFIRLNLLKKSIKIT